VTPTITQVKAPFDAMEYIKVRLRALDVADKEIGNGWSLRREIAARTQALLPSDVTRRAYIFLASLY